MKTSGPVAAWFAMALLAPASLWAADAKPKFASPVVTTKTPGHAVEIDVDIAGAKQLYLIVTDAGDTFSCDWSDWAEPRLVGPQGETKLTELKWKSAEAGFGSVGIDKNCGGQQMRINGQKVTYGIGTHANSTIVYDLPPGYTRFKARGGIDNGGSDQAGGAASSVTFLVYTETPPAGLFKAEASPPGGVDHDPALALSYLDAGEGLEASLFASEPMMTNPADIDIDYRGRVWVCDVQNYRGRKGYRPEGDRILILEDTDGDGKADKATVFYQGKDIDSALGICVLGNKVIVSCSPNVWIFTDEDGDGKADKKELLFSKTGMEQHDHSAHAFTFGPDGKLYWNFGNTGHAVHDKDGNPVKDVDGNVVNDLGKPYRNGMAFRCNIDGSEFEVLGHNFRNNYEVAVDSFGTLWQSDNDDDGNRGVRINYVMEHGNFGYVDEFTGAAWTTPYTGQPDDIPTRHWHQSDPGVVPNLLQTGGGSPAGILVYEGDLLPADYRNQVIHCDPGPNVVRAYPVQVSGAGYTAGIADVLVGTRNSWFRPADLCTAPDGSLMIADWYDPGVGGHGMGDMERGRIFRIATPGATYAVPKFDFASIEGAIEALKNPCLSVRYLAWTSLHEKGVQAEPALLKLYESSNPRYRARALWLLSKIPDRGGAHVEKALHDKDPDIRLTGLRAARQLKLDVVRYVKQLAHEAEPRVRRECALALRRQVSSDVPEVWADLALQHQHEDRWYLEALGIGAEGQWDALFDAWLKKAGKEWNSPAGRDIVWRSRARAAMPLLAQLIADPATGSAERLRYFRAFDFQADPSKQQVLVDLLKGNHPQQTAINVLALKQLHGADPSRAPELKKALDEALDGARGTDSLVDLVEMFNRADRYPDVLKLALDNPTTSAGVAAARLLLRNGGQALFNVPLAAEDGVAEKALGVLGLTQETAGVDLIAAVVNDAKRTAALRNVGVAALGRSRAGEQVLLAMAGGDKLAPELQFAAARVLQASTDAGIRAEAAKHLTLPEAADSKPLPPLADLLARKGNVERGKTVFETTGTCAKCHIVNGQGTEVGPNLSEIGSKLSREAFFESILYPSAAIGANYETFLVELDSGNQVSGLITNETADSLTIKASDAIVRTFKKSEVVDKKKLAISLMPADLQKVMTADDLVDVVEYLMTLKK